MTATLTPTFEIGDEVTTYTGTTPGRSRLRPIDGTVEAICPSYGLLVVDRSAAYPRGGWFLTEEVERANQQHPARRAAALRGWETRREQSSDV